LSAASPSLLQHRGRAVVFENIEDFHSSVNDDSLDIDENCIMVLQNCGPRGYPGMAEVGNMPLPGKLLRKGVTDMVRISDARMSGTASTSGRTASMSAMAMLRQLTLWLGKFTIQSSGIHSAAQRGDHEESVFSVPDRRAHRRHFDQRERADTGRSGSSADKTTARGVVRRLDDDFAEAADTF
jgi:hypothetical protein